MKKSIGLLLVAAAAYGAYRYSKMSASERQNLKGMGKDFLDKKLGLGKISGKRNAAHS